jgi:hypothetical protein
MQIYEDSRKKEPHGPSIQISLLIHGSIAKIVMGTKFTEDEKKLYRRIDEILYSDWNPIGFGYLPSDEYTSYVPEIYKLKKSKAPREIIAQALFKIETDHIGLSGDIEKCRVIAKMIENL